MAPSRVTRLAQVILGRGLAFGIPSRFRQRPYRNLLSLLFGKVSEVVFPEVPETKVQAKSTVTATITQVGGAKHELTDVRVKDGQLEFRKGETRREVKIEKIARIEVPREAPPGYVCKVKLKSGAEQEPKMYSYKFCGKGPDFYEVLETYSIRSIEFGPVDADKK